MIMSVKFIIFLYILHGSLHIEKEFWMSLRTSWIDMICVCYGVHSHFVTNAADFLKIDGVSEYSGCDETHMHVVQGLFF